MLKCNVIEMLSYLTPPPLTIVSLKPKTIRRSRAKWQTKAVFSTYLYSFPNLIPLKTGKSSIPHYGKISTDMGSKKRERFKNEQ